MPSLNPQSCFLFLPPPSLACATAHWLPDLKKYPNPCAHKGAWVGEDESVIDVIYVNSPRAQSKKLKSRQVDAQSLPLLILHAFLLSFCPQLAFRVSLSSPPSLLPSVLLASFRVRESTFVSNNTPTLIHHPCTSWFHLETLAVVASGPEGNDLLQPQRGHCRHRHLWRRVPIAPSLSAKKDLEMRSR